MSEADMKSLLVKKLEAINAVRIESTGTGIGIPDVNHTYGWIECKWMKLWPRNIKDPIKFHHPLTKEQQIWLWRRERAKGAALVCGKISNYWFFWSGQKIRDMKLWDNMNKTQMELEAEIVFKGKMESQPLINFLRSYQQNLASANI